MQTAVFRPAITSAVLALVSSSVLAGGHNAAIREAMQDPKKMETFMEARLDHTTGLEDKKAELGQGIVALVEELGGKLDLSKSSDEELGQYILTAVKTMNHNDSYKHENNDALDKLHLTAVSMAKYHDMYTDLVAKDVKTTQDMMKRRGGAIKMTARQYIALKAIIEQTT